MPLTSEIDLELLDCWVLLPRRGADAELGLVAFLFLDAGELCAQVALGIRWVAATRKVRVDDLPPLILRGVSVGVAARFPEDLRRHLGLPERPFGPCAMGAERGCSDWPRGALDE